MIPRSSQRLARLGEISHFPRSFGGLSLHFSQTRLNFGDTKKILIRNPPRIQERAATFISYLFSIKIPNRKYRDDSLTKLLLENLINVSHFGLSKCFSGLLGERGTARLSSYMPLKIDCSQQSPPAIQQN